MVGHQTLPAVDFRFRPAVGRNANLAAWTRRWELADQLGTACAPTVGDDWRARIREAGLGRVVVTGRVAKQVSDVEEVNDEIVELASGEESVLAVPAISAGFGRTSSDSIFDLLSKSEVVGLCLEPGKERVPTVASDPAYTKFVAACADAGKFVMVTQSMLMGPRESWSPRPVSALTVRHPTLRIVIGHGAWPHINEALELALRHENVWISPDVYWRSATKTLPWSNERLIRRYVFGSGYPLDTPASALGHLRSLTSEDHIEVVLRSNAAALLGRVDEA